MTWLKLGSILGYLTPILVLTYKLWFEQYFKKKLVKFSTELETEKEKQLANYSKNITGFNKFIEKKYEIYPKLFLELKKTQGEIMNWWPTQFINDFSKLTKEEMQGYLDSFNFSVPDKRFLIEKRENNNLKQVDFLRLLPNHIHLSIQLSNNYFQYNRLFISKDVESLINEIILHFNNAWSGYFKVFSSFATNSDNGDIIEKSYEESGKKIIILLNLMRSELEHDID